ncbi:MAG: Fpg/Nei family DNA glycosylase, partial [Myxococcaceae bacterium]
TLTLHKDHTICKHLLIHFSGGLTLRTHLLMNGSWHIYRQGEKWKRPASSARVVVETEDFVAIAFDIQEAELLTDAQLGRHDELSKLGPDLLNDAFKFEEVLPRARKRPGLTIAEALLNQRIASGIGNVYKSEALFLSGVNPFVPVSSLTDEQLGAIYETAKKVMRANVGDPRKSGIVTYTGYRRTTRNANPEEKVWVYGRTGKPCRKCGTAIEMKRQGLDARSTYWCPTCQPSGQRV